MTGMLLSIYVSQSFSSDFPYIVSAVYGTYCSALFIAIHKADAKQPNPVSSLGLPQKLVYGSNGNSVVLRYLLKNISGSIITPA